MSKKLYILALLLIFATALEAKLCNIFIHGYTAKQNGYFGNVERQVLWDSSLPVNESAPLVALEILKQMATCDENDQIVLRPHSYGAAQVFYILGQGRRFQTLTPDHPFVLIYKKTLMVYSYTGAYHGTPLMDIICSIGPMRAVGSFVGKSCVPTLLTSSKVDVSSFVRSPGVPTYLLYSTDAGGYLGIPGAMISKFGVGFWDYFFKGKRTQNDNTLPIHATMGCAENTPIRDSEQRCIKLDSNYFFDIYHERNFNHTEFLTNSEYMQRELPSWK